MKYLIYNYFLTIGMGTNFYDTLNTFIVLNTEVPASNFIYAYSKYPNNVLTNKKLIQ